MSQLVKVGILEDDQLMADYLRSVLIPANGVHLAFCAPTIRDAFAALKQTPDVDLCLVDLQLPDGIGTEFVKHLTSKTEAKALILTVLGDKVSVMAGLESGAHGYLLKDSAPDQILRHIEEVIKGANPMSAQASTHLLSLVKESQSRDARRKLSVLTDRETEILTFFAKGMSYRETAAALNLSTHTVSDYVKSIYRKLGVNSRNEAVFEAMQMGWIDI